MIALTATVNAARDGVDLAVAGATGAVQIARRDRNGVAPVRAPYVVDLEVALGGPVRYVAVDSTGARSEVNLTMPGTHAPQLRRTYTPGVVADLELVLNISSSRELRRTEHDVIDRDDTILTTGRLKLRAGTFALLCSSYAVARDVERVYAEGQVVHLRTPNIAGLDLHHVGTNVAVSPDSQDVQRSSVVVTYREVLPAAAETVAAWKYSDAAAAFPSYLLASLAYGTYADARVDYRGGAA